jgi:hypothetical protein
MRESHRGQVHRAEPEPPSRLVRRPSGQARPIGEPTPRSSHPRALFMTAGNAIAGNPEVTAANTSPRTNGAYRGRSPVVKPPIDRTIGISPLPGLPGQRSISALGQRWRAEPDLVESLETINPSQRSGQAKTQRGFAPGQPTLATCRVVEHRQRRYCDQPFAVPSRSCRAIYEPAIPRVHALGGRRGKVTIAWPGPTVMSPLELSVWMENSR